MENSIRKLVSVKTITDVQPIQGADLIQVATIDYGWNVVVKKDEFKVGDQAVYFEIDSFLPEGNPAWQFLVDKSSRMFNGVKGHKLRSIKLKGVVSQGLVLPVSVFPEIEKTEDKSIDFNEMLGVSLWEAPIPSEMVGQVKSTFPVKWFPKSEQTRAQNIVPEIFGKNSNTKYEVTMKLDGSSISIYNVNGEFGVCSRNMDLKINEENANNSFVKTSLDTNLQTILPQLGNFMVQGELMGGENSLGGIQGNPEKFVGYKIFIYNVYNVDEKKWLNPIERNGFVENLYTMGCNQNVLKHVPIIHSDVTLSDLGILDIKSLIAYADGPSIIAKRREGLVYKSIDGDFSFKTISNRWLLDNE